jgi:threonine synthase
LGLLFDKQSKVFFLDDTRNPTSSFKDRASMLVALKAKELGIKEIAAASTGNAGSSLAGICARLGLRAHIWVPAAIPEGKLLQLLAYGAQVYLVEGNYDMAFDLCLEISEGMEWYNRNTAYNPLTIEGKKSAAYDIFFSTSQEAMPDVILVPTGDGVIIAGIYKGLWELLQLGLISKLPRLVAVQSQLSDSLVRYRASGKFEYVSPSSIADSINAGAPRNLFMAADALAQTEGLAVAVSDESILDAQKELARNHGMLVEPAAAAGLAGYHALQKEGYFKKQDRVLLMFTGHGLKDPRSIERWINKPVALAPSQWREQFQQKRTHQSK